jgi:short-subunit dehydrogenase
VQLEGKRLLLSGATGGLGRAIAAALGDRGAALVLSARKRDALESLAAELPGQHDVAPSDLAEPGAGERLIAAAGEVDGLIANAALPATGRLESFSPEEVERALRINLEAPIRMTHALLPALTERGEGHLVFVSSLASRAASPRASLYTATKAGLRGFAFSLRADLHSRGIGVSVISPGFIREAGMYADSGATSAPMGLGTKSPQHVARAVVKAIETNRGEISVAPIRQRGLANFSLIAPRLTVRIMRGGTSSRAGERLAEGQSDKR